MMPSSASTQRQPGSAGDEERPHEVVGDQPVHVDRLWQPLEMGVRPSMGMVGDAYDDAGAQRPRFMRAVNGWVSTSCPIAETTWNSVGCRSTR